MRKDNYIKKEDKKPVKLFTLDTETRGFKGDIFRLGIYDGKNYLPSNDFKEIKQELLNASITHDVHIFIHNLNFDLGKIIKDLQTEILWFNSIIINGRSTIIKTNDFTFHDSYSLFPKSLEKLSKDFDIKNRKMDLVAALQETAPEYLVYKKQTVSSYYDEQKDELIKVVKDTNEIDKKKTLENYFMNVDPLDPLLNEYLEFDCISLFEIVSTTVKLSNMTKEDFVLCPTTASLSLKAYQTLFKKDYETAIISKYEGRDLEVEKKLMKAYYGGRTEVFIPHLKNGYHYDVNSLYPYVMRKYKYPVGEYKILKGSQARIQWKVYSKNEKGGGVVNATIKIPKSMNYPILPFRAYKQGKLLFPAGEISGSWTAAELLFAVRRGVEILELHEFIYFYRMENLFDRFVTYFEKMKKDNTPDPNDPDKKVNPALREFSKLILNSLYGKFATGREKTSYCSLREIETAITELSKKDDLFTPEIEFFKNVLAGGVEFAQNEYREVNPLDLLKRMPTRFKHTGIDETILQFTNYLTAQYVQIQISAYVTSYARMELYLGMEDIFKRGGLVYYCDTDSLAVDIPMLPENVHDSDFGKWKLENMIAAGYFVQPKVYAEITTKGKLLKKFKGLPKDKVEEFNEHDYKFIQQRQKKKDVDKIPLIKKEDGYQNIIKPITAIKQNKQFNHLIDIEKGLKIRGLMEKRNIDYEGNKSEPYYFEAGETNSEQEYLERLHQLNIQTATRPDPFRKQLEKGFIKIPDKNEDIYFEYSLLEKKTKAKYFRKTGKQTLQIFAAAVEYTPEDLLLEFSLEI